MYTEQVMDHFMNPRNMGEIADANGVGEVGNAKCGDIMKMYLKIENDVKASLNVERTIIATGGSAIYGKEAMKHLKEIGEVVYLKADYETIKKRLGNLEKRGVALKSGQTLKDLYDERTKLYEMYADVTVDEKGLGTEETIGAVLRSLNLLDDI